MGRFTLIYVQEKEKKAQGEKVAKDGGRNIRQGRGGGGEER
jgi:hypothetical protein